jgi:hypothetical protein
MKKWLCLVLGFSFLTIYSQSLSYKVLQDRCQSVNPKYMFSLMFGQFDMKLQGNDGFPLRAGLKGMVAMSDALSVQGDLSIAYKNVWPRKDLNIEWLGLPVAINGGVDWKFSDNAYKVSHKMTLRKSTATFRDGTKITETDYLYCKGGRRRAWSLRGGVNYYTQSTNLSKYVRIKNLGLMEKKSTIIDTSTGMWSRNMALYAGINLQEIVDYVVDIERFGKRSKQYIKNISVDMIYMLGQNFKYQDMAVGATTDLRGQTIDKAKIENAFGAKGRIGWRVITDLAQIGYGKNNDKAGGIFTMEFGNKPYTGWYWNLGVGVAIAQKNKD